MSLFKLQNYSAIKNLQDNPRVEATVETVNGNVFGVVDNLVVGDRTIKEAQVPFADAAAAQAGDVWAMMNIVDKPEIRNYADYSVLAGEKIRAVNLNKISGEIVELSGDLVIDGAGGALPPAVGVFLIPTSVAVDAPNSMVWKTADAAGIAGYGCYLEITAVTTFGTFTIDNAGAGYEAKIRTA